MWTELYLILTLYRMQNMLLILIKKLFSQPTSVLIIHITVALNSLDQTSCQVSPHTSYTAYLRNWLAFYTRCDVSCAAKNRGICSTFKDHFHFFHSKFLTFCGLASTEWLQRNYVKMVRDREFPAKLTNYLNCIDLWYMLILSLLNRLRGWNISKAFSRTLLSLKIKS